MAYVKTNWLDAATSPQATTPEELVGIFRFATETVVTGSPSSMALRLEGSINGAEWFTLMNIGASGVASVTDPRPVKLVRFNLVDLAGGSSPTVTASMVVQEVLG